MKWRRMESGWIFIRSESFEIWRDFIPRDCEYSATPLDDNIIIFSIFISFFLYASEDWFELVLASSKFQLQDVYVIFRL